MDINCLTLFLVTILSRFLLAGFKPHGIFFCSTTAFCYVTININNLTLFLASICNILHPHFYAKRFPRFLLAGCIPHGHFLFRDAISKMPDYIEPKALVATLETAIANGKTEWQEVDDFVLSQAMDEFKCFLFRDSYLSF